MSDARELGAEALYRRCDPEMFAFVTTAELEDLVGGPRTAVLEELDILSVTVERSL